VHEMLILLAGVGLIFGHPFYCRYNADFFVFGTNMF
jgi:hypothetical protein